MKTIYDDWLTRKRTQNPIKLIRNWSKNQEWQIVTGGRIMSANLTLAAKPSVGFQFIDEVIWPINSSVYSECVLDGILDAVLIDLAASPEELAFTLTQITWNNEEATKYAYYRAAREAVKSIIELDRASLFKM